MAVISITAGIVQITHECPLDNIDMDLAALLHLVRSFAPQYPELKPLPDMASHVGAAHQFDPYEDPYGDKGRRRVGFTTT